VADELEAIRQLKARYCRFPRYQSGRVLAQLVRRRRGGEAGYGGLPGGAALKTAPPLEGVDNFVPMVGRCSDHAWRNTRRLEPVVAAYRHGG
jgi:hypothetical protein